MLAPAFGPTIGGWIIEYFGWRSIFAINIPIGLIALLVIIRSIPYYRIGAKNTFDLVGLLAATVSNIFLLFGFSQGDIWGWTSGKTLLTLILGIVILGFFIKWELSIKTPLLQLRLLKNFRFTYSLGLNSLLTISLYAVALLIPIYLQDVQRLSVLQTGLILLPGSLALAAVSPLIGKIYGKTGPFWLILIGTFLIGAATWALAHLGLSTSIGFIVALLVLRYIGIALSNMPVNNVGMSSIPKVDSGNASAITNWVRQGVAALSVGIFSSLLGARITIHLRELQLLYPAGHSFIGQQALTLGVNDVFMVGTTIAAIAIPVTILLRYSKVEARKKGSL